MVVGLHPGRVHDEHRRIGRVSSPHLACLSCGPREMDLLSIHRPQPLLADRRNVLGGGPVIEFARNRRLGRVEVDRDGVAVGGTYPLTGALEAPLRVGADHARDSLRVGPVVLRRDRRHEVVGDRPAVCVEREAHVVREVSERAAHELRNSSPLARVQQSLARFCAGRTRLPLERPVAGTAPDLAHAISYRGERENSSSTIIYTEYGHTHE